MPRCHDPLCPVCSSAVTLGSTRARQPRCRGNRWLTRVIAGRGHHGRPKWMLGISHRLARADVGVARAPAHLRELRAMTPERCMPGTADVAWSLGPGRWPLTASRGRCAEVGRPQGMPARSMRASRWRGPLSAGPCAGGAAGVACLQLAPARPCAPGAADITCAYGKAALPMRAGAWAGRAGRCPHGASGFDRATRARHRRGRLAMGRPDKPMRARHCRGHLAMGRPGRPTRPRHCRRRPSTPLGASSALGTSSASACH